MIVQFCGAAREVTGSCHLITLANGYKILLDCGLYQGKDKTMQDFNTNWLFRPADIDCLILSHAHIDHTGRVPKLVRDGFKGRIYTTQASRDLSSIMLLDSARIQEKDAQYLAQQAPRGGSQAPPDPLYGTEDVAAALALFVSYPYNTPFQVCPEVTVCFTDAGHILGSAAVSMQIVEKGKTLRFGFSGDIGRPNRPILNDPQPMLPLDFLLCESTYGDRDHPAAPEELDKFLAIIENTCVTKKGKLLIPAFSVGRTQEIVYMLDQLVDSGRLPQIPVFVDSPLAVDATDVFIRHPECFDQDLHHYMLTDPNPFGFKDLTYVRSVDESKALNDRTDPCIIISASGMANAGRIQHHILNNIENPSTTVLMVGYCSPETIGGQLRSGNKSIYILGQKKQVKADIAIMDSFSAHGDRHEILSFIANQKSTVRKIYLVHGDYPTQQAFVTFLGQNGFPNVDIPNLGDTLTISADTSGKWNAVLTANAQAQVKYATTQSEEGSGE